MHLISSGLDLCQKPEVALSDARVVVAGLDEVGLNLGSEPEEEDHLLDPLARDAKLSGEIGL